jgi:hypothetical protein
MNPGETHRGDMVCEVMPDILLYGAMPLLNVCATTAIVPAFYRVYYDTDLEILYSGKLETSARRCPCPKEGGGRSSPDSCTSVVCCQGIQFKGSQFPNKVTGISGNLHFDLHGDASWGIVMGDSL